MNEEIIIQYFQMVILYQQCTTNTASRTFLSLILSKLACDTRSNRELFSVKQDICPLDSLLVMGRKHFLGFNIYTEKQLHKCNNLVMVKLYQLHDTVLDIFNISIIVFQGITPGKYFKLFTLFIRTLCISNWPFSYSNNLNLHRKFSNSFFSPWEI